MALVLTEEQAMLAEAARGGSGFGFVGAGLIAEEMGRTLAASDMRRMNTRPPSAKPTTMPSVRSRPLKG